MEYEIKMFTGMNTLKAFHEVRMWINEMADEGWTLHTFIVTPDTDDTHPMIYVVLERQKSVQ